jgi:hypothetical protein
MEITWNRFTFPKGVIKTDNTKIKNKVRESVAKMKVSVSPKLQSYEASAKKNYKELF